MSLGHFEQRKKIRQAYNKKLASIKIFNDAKSTSQEKLFAFTWKRFLYLSPTCMFSQKKTLTTDSSLAKRNLSINCVFIILTSCTIELLRVRKAFTTANTSSKAAGAKSPTFRVLSEDWQLSLNVKITSLGEGSFPLNWPLFQQHRMVFNFLSRLCSSYLHQPDGLFRKLPQSSSYSFQWWSPGLEHVNAPTATPGNGEGHRNSITHTQCPKTVGRHSGVRCSSQLKHPTWALNFHFQLKESIRVFLMGVSALIIFHKQNVTAESVLYSIF